MMDLEEAKKVLLEPIIQKLQEEVSAIKCLACERFSLRKASDLRPHYCEWCYENDAEAKKIKEERYIRNQKNNIRKHKRKKELKAEQARKEAVERIRKYEKESDPAFIHDTKYGFDRFDTKPNFKRHPANNTGVDLTKGTGR